VATSGPNPQEGLRREILDDGRRRRDEILLRARQEADALAAAAGAEAERERQEQLALARTEADRRAEAILATIPVEAGRLRASRVEALLQSIHDATRARLLARSDFDFRESVIVLAADALNRMSGPPFTARLSRADHAALGDGWVESLHRRPGIASGPITVIEDSRVAPGSLVIEGAEGRQSWNIGLLARLERLWPALRQQIAAAALSAETTGPGPTQDHP
jgi:vacuolar-type H+-ATPase subunit E/Vma4